MSSRGGPRRSGGESAYGDDYGGVRWDRERFERVRARSRGPIAEERVQVEEYDQYPGRREVRVEVDEGRRGSKGRRKESESFVEEDVYSPPRRRRPQMEEERIEISGREMLPYQPRDKWEKEREASARRPMRPMYARRQSSLDTFDRRPLPKYSEEERDINVSINVIPPRIPEPRYQDREYRYKDPYIYRDDPPPVRVRREVEREIIRSPEKEEKVEESSDSFEEIEIPEKPKRGKTRMPKRLVHRAALVQLGYSFSEEEDFYVVRQALLKEQIDDVIKVSESYFNDNKVVYKFQDPKLIEAPPPPRAPIIISAPSISSASSDPEEVERPVEIIETITTRIIENPTPEDFTVRKSRSEYKSVTSASSSRSSSSSSTATERPDHVPLTRTVVAQLTDDAIVVPGRRRSVAKSSKAKSVRSSKSKTRGRSPGSSESESPPRSKKSAAKSKASSRAKSAASSESEESAMVIVSSRRKSVRESRDIKAEIRALEAQQRKMDKEERGERKHKSESFVEVEKKEEVQEKSSSGLRVEKDGRGRLVVVRPR